MKKISAVLVCTLVGSFLSSNLIPATANAASYCLAVRGNGELAPAHWGAIASVVESQGLPAAMSGGSSASISLFLLESIALNPNVASGSNIEKKQVASLLLKSLQSYLEVVASHPEWQEMKSLAQYLKQAGGGTREDFAKWLKMMVERRPQELAALVLQHGAEIQQSLKLAIRIGLVNPQTFQPLIRQLALFSPASIGAMTPEAKELALKQIQFFAGEIYQSVALLGAFNAESDQNLFFRPGIINFSALADSFGRVGNFYAERGMTASQSQALRDFVKTCAPLADRKTWDELRKTNPSCDTTFKTILVDYQSNPASAVIRGRQLDRVGNTIPSFPGTAVLSGKAYELADAALQQYPISLDPNFGQNFSVNEADVSFGYWGPAAQLATVARNMTTPFRDAKGATWDFTRDEKSRRFLSLGEGTWADAMKASPAEPGLAPFQKISTPNGPAYSAGGWSDLHPAAVLKAAGCNEIIYVTRRGGESLFGQGVAKRLLGFANVSWSRLATDAAHKAANVVLNNNGDLQDMSSTWSRLYNLANPESSFNRALDIFTTVVCTDWNRFDIKAPNAVSEMIDDAYHAPWIRTNALAKKMNVVDPARGYRPFAGCVSFAGLK